MVNNRDKQINKDTGVIERNHSIQLSSISQNERVVNVGISNFSNEIRDSTATDAFDTREELHNLSEE